MDTVQVKELYDNILWENPSVTLIIQLAVDNFI